MLNRVILNRSISIPFGGPVKDGQISPTPDTQTTNLSPSIQPEIQSFSALFNLSEHERQLINSSNEDLSSSSSQTSMNNANGDLAKKCIKKGDYILFEPSSQNDSFSTAFNTKTNKIYFWKVRTIFM